MDVLELVEGVRQLSRRLRDAKISHAFGGAIAYGFYGIPRATNDWDINIFLPEARAKEVFAALEPIGIVATVESYQEVEEKGQVRLDWGGKKVDLFFAYVEFHSVVQSRIRDTVFEGEPISVLACEDIIVFKVIFDRPHDWRDIERVFHRMGPDVDLDYVTKWLTEILSTDDSRIARLLETVEKAREISG